MNQDEKKAETGMDDLFRMWTESTAKIFESMKDVSPNDMGFADFLGASEKGPVKKSEKMFRSGTKIFQSLIATLSRPENLDAFLKGSEMFPEFMVSMNQQVWGGYFELQRQWMERAARFGKHTEAYQFEDMDQETFQAIRDIYVKEFRKFLQVPPLGLNRFPQERLQKFFDQLNLVQITLSEFIYTFYLPIEKSLNVMQEKAEEMIEAGQMTDDFKSYYNMWIRTLEGHYMTLLKSKEYTEVLKKTIDTVVQYRQTRDDLMYDILKHIPVPTNREMDDLYKEFYLLKKKVRALEKKMALMDEENPEK